MAQKEVKFDVLAGLALKLKRPSNIKEFWVPENMRDFEGLQHAGKTSSNIKEFLTVRQAWCARLVCTRETEIAQQYHGIFDFRKNP